HHTHHRQHPHTASPEPSVLFTLAQTQRPIKCPPAKPISNLSPPLVTSFPPSSSPLLSSPLVTSFPPSSSLLLGKVGDSTTQLSLMRSQKDNKDHPPQQII